MREKSGRIGRATNKLKALLLAVAAVFAFSAVAATSANAADGSLKLTFDKGQIAVLPELLGPVDATPPAGSAVVVEGTLKKDGSFSATKEGFDFPTQRIPLPEEAAGILGPHVDIILASTNSFTGNFNSGTGAFTGTIPLALTLQFQPSPEATIACALPFNLNVNTTGTLTFPGAGEGGSDLKFPAAPFAAPSREGSVYGYWEAVKFTDVVDAPPMPSGGTVCAGLLGALPLLIPDWPAGLDGLPGEIWLGGKATVVEPTEDTCPAGQTGTPPNCKAAVGTVGKLTITKKVTVKRGKVAKVKVTVTNSGTGTLSGKIALKSSNKQVKAPKSVAVSVAGGKSVTKTIKVKTTKKAKGKANITASMGGKKAKAVVTIKR